ncbi:hypothetical protein L356_06846 [Enterobacter sp. MGH 10]|uniref:hypothetical protein n=1 Tax=Enterobacter cloacae complex TaxID=354276 RepID=UPI00044603B5|nr:MULTISPECIES: hypothetical protein [Enterobacter cloacae complex]ELE9247756.1 hypothetical protein [Enterobacter kobei]MBT2109438.1 hypothetical protein [Enterobacter hormaechei subsp. xiangfangensis]EUM79716.1 hypothetical protein L356_06846 [Enterobacter sp. MGH 10]MCM7891032.1 hypothetical protein [Enterobacter hormaechei]MCM7895537.1 hypothetical protein [Enterobacter hormaechei]
MTPNKYAALRATIVRAKRHDCQKVVMRVTLAEELLDQLSNAEKRIAELEARMVKLPERYEVDMCPTPSPNGEWYSREDILAALVSAGVRYAAGIDKGE